MIFTQWSLESLNIKSMVMGKVPDRKSLTFEMTQNFIEKCPLLYSSLWQIDAEENVWSLISALFEIHITWKPCVPKKSLKFLKI